MLFDEKIDKESWDESSIKLKVMEETERKMIEIFKEELKRFSGEQFLIAKDIYSKLMDEFNNRWFK